MSDEKSAIMEADSPPPTYSETAPTTTVVVQQPVESAIVFRDSPVTLPDGTVTTLQYKNGLMTWLVVLLVCLFTVELCLCCLGLIPFCLNIVKDVEHINPKTGEVVGVYKRL